MNCMSHDQTTRQAAEQQIEQAKASNLVRQPAPSLPSPLRAAPDAPRPWQPLLMSLMATELANEAKEGPVRQGAGLVLKNCLSAKVRQLRGAGSSRGQRVPRELAGPAGRVRSPAIAASCGVGAGQGRPSPSHARPPCSACLPPRTGRCKAGGSCGAVDCIRRDCQGADQAVGIWLPWQRGPRCARRGGPGRGCGGDD